MSFSCSDTTFPKPPSPVTCLHQADGCSLRNRPRAGCRIRRTSPPRPILSEAGKVGADFPDRKTYRSSSYSPGSLHLRGARRATVVKAASTFGPSFNTHRAVSSMQFNCEIQRKWNTLYQQIPCLCALRPACYRLLFAFANLKVPIQRCKWSRSHGLPDR